METIYQRVAGLDIHKKNIVACLRKTGSDGALDEDIRIVDTDHAGWIARTPYRDVHQHYISGCQPRHTDRISGRRAARPSMDADSPNALSRQVGPGLGLAQILSATCPECPNGKRSRGSRGGGGRRGLPVVHSTTPGPF